MKWNEMKWNEMKYANFMCSNHVAVALQSSSVIRVDGFCVVLWCFALMLLRFDASLWCFALMLRFDACLRGQWFDAARCQKAVETGTEYLTHKPPLVSLSIVGIYSTCSLWVVCCIDVMCGPCMQSQHLLYTCYALANAFAMHLVCLMCALYSMLSILLVRLVLLVLLV